MLVRIEYSRFVKSCLWLGTRIGNSVLFLFCYDCALMRSFSMN